MNVSRCRFWFCNVCSGVCEKEDLQNRMFLYVGNTVVRGTIECGNCHTYYQQSDIYKGKHYLPQQHWDQFQRATGKMIMLTEEG